MDNVGDEDLPPLRSINHIDKSFIRFINTTEHSVVLYWIDYQGQAINYGTLLSGNCRDINTFVTHPWIFVDSDTSAREWQEDTVFRYTVNQKDVFFPEPGSERCERKNVYITLPLYSLRQLAMRVIKRRLARDSHAFKLEIPRHLQFELSVALPRKNYVANEDENS